MGTSHMKHEMVRIGLVRHVTVDTLTRNLRIINDCRLLESSQLALKYSHMAIHLVAWSNTAVGQSPLIQRIVAHRYLEVLVLCPLTSLQHANGISQLTAFVLRQQLMPLIDVEVSPLALNMHGATLATLHIHVDSLRILVLHTEIQGSYPNGNGNPDIVRIQLGQLVGLLGILHLSGTTGKHRS